MKITDYANEIKTLLYSSLIYLNIEHDVALILSSCFGKKKLENTLSWIGLFWYYLLYTLDYNTWKKGGHCVASIMSDEEINNFKDRQWKQQQF
jgi:hypothetical protein